MLKPSQRREAMFYAKTSLFAAAVFLACFGYLKFLDIPGEVNKSVADTAIILMGLSMLISSICYYWNRFDWTIIYRKYLGLVGFAFGIAHLLLSWGAFTSLFRATTWSSGAYMPALAGVVALGIFAIMAAVSNTFAASKLGGKVWRYILRTGYLAVIFVFLHVVLLKSARWVSWFTEGMKTLPSLSLLVSIFMVVVIVMRLLLWFSLWKAAKKIDQL